METQRVERERGGREETVLLHCAELAGTNSFASEWLGTVCIRSTSNQTEPAGSLSNTGELLTSDSGALCIGGTVLGTEAFLCVGGSDASIASLALQEATTGLSKVGTWDTTLVGAALWGLTLVVLEGAACIVGTGQVEANTATVGECLHTGRCRVVGTLSCLLGLTDLVAASNASVGVKGYTGESSLTNGGLAQPGATGITGECLVNLGRLDALPCCIVARQGGGRVTCCDRLSGVSRLVTTRSCCFLDDDFSAASALVAVQGGILVSLADLLFLGTKPTGLTLVALSQTDILNLLIAIAVEWDARGASVGIARTVGVVLTVLEAVGLVEVCKRDTGESGATRFGLTALITSFAAAGTSACRTGESGAFGATTGAVCTFRVCEADGRALVGLTSSTDTGSSTTRAQDTLSVGNARGGTVSAGLRTSSTNARSPTAGTASTLRASGTNAGTCLLGALAGAADAGSTAVGAQTTVGVVDAGIGTNGSAANTASCTGLASRWATKAVGVGATGRRTTWSLAGAIPTGGSTTGAKATLAVRSTA